MTRAGRLAYFRHLRSKWSDEALAAWKVNWKAKTAGWKRKRGVEDVPRRKKLIAKKTQGLPIEDADEGGPYKRTRSRKGDGRSVEDDAGIQLVHR